MRKFSRNCVGLLIVATAVMGCDSLKARKVAGDAADLYHEGKIDEAIAKYHEAATIDPNIATIWLNLGFANQMVYQANPKTPMGDKAAADAVHSFEQFLRLKPEDERGRQYLIQTFVDTSQYDAAVKYFQPQVQKNDPEAFNTLGLIASKTGNFQAARDWYQKRVDADPKNPDAKLSLGVLIWDFLHNHKEVAGDSRKQLADDGIKILAQAIEQAPNAPNAYTYTNLLYRERAEADLTDDEKRPDLEKANEFFKKAMQLQKAAK